MVHAAICAKSHRIIQAHLSDMALPTPEVGKTYIIGRLLTSPVVKSVPTSRGWMVQTHNSLYLMCELTEAELIDITEREEK